MQNPSSDWEMIAILFSHLEGKGIQWAAAMWEKQGEEMHDYRLFKTAFTRGFDHQVAGRQGGEWLADKVVSDCSTCGRKNYLQQTMCSNSALLRLPVTGLLHRSVPRSAVVSTSDQS